MSRSCRVIVGFLIAAICSCGNVALEKNIAEKESPRLTEIITKSYSVKVESGTIVKDTVNMIQSMIVDETEREVANTYYSLDGSVNWKDEYIYDKGGNKIGSKYFEKDNKQTIYYEYDLDSEGRKIAFRAKEVDTDTLLYDGAIRYKDNGKIRRDGYINKKGEFRYNFEYQFDDKGKELGYVYIDLSSGDKYPALYKYVAYNEEQQWIERQIVENEEVNSIEVREFRDLN